jgi:hypothetical protein
MPLTGGHANCHTTATPPRFAPFHVLLGAVLAVSVRPALWWSTLRLLGRIARPGWWRRAPFLPLPDAAYVRFRLETAYGADGTPATRDLIAYLRWCRERDRDRRHARH